MKVYVQRTKQLYTYHPKPKQCAAPETVGEFPTTVQAVAFLRKQQVMEPKMHFYLSTRPCRAWKENHETDDRRSHSQEN